MIKTTSSTTYLPNKTLGKQSKTGNDHECSYLRITVGNAYTSCWAYDMHNIQYDVIFTTAFDY